MVLPHNGVSMPQLDIICHQNPSAMNGLYLFMFLSKRVINCLHPPKKLQVLVKVIGYYPPNNNKTMLLKTLHTYTTEHGEMHVIFNWTNPHWITFTVLEAAMYAFGGES